MVYKLTRDVLCAVRLRVLRSVGEICRGEIWIVVIERVVDATIMETIFRSAAALAIDGALLTRTPCNPLSWKPLRVSVGSVSLLS